MAKKTNTLVTHNGGFHADDIFACATLQIYLDQLGETYTIERTRDSEKIQDADYVFDVGGIYDTEKNRFDHHQKGGAGERENGIPYAAFGLIWKAYGEKICDSIDIATRIDQKIVEPIDAIDNGVNLTEQLVPNVYPYTLQALFGAFEPTWKEGDRNIDAIFLEMVMLAKQILNREVERTRDIIDAEMIVQNVYENAEDKRILFVKEPISRNILQNYSNQFSEPLFVVAPRGDGNWRIVTIHKNIGSFEARKDLPEKWAGLRDQELAEITGISDAVFCHNARFMCIAKSKESIQKLAELALQA